MLIETQFLTLHNSTHYKTGDRVPRGHFRGTREASPGYQDSWLDFRRQGLLIRFSLESDPDLREGIDLFHSIV